MSNSATRIIIAVTGASGSIYADDLIERLLCSDSNVTEIAIVRSKNAMQVWAHELQKSWPGHDKIAYFDSHDFNAPFASGSSKWDAMVVIPASMGTVARIAHGISDELITRTADVFLKERRSLIICPRESPMSPIHLSNLLSLSQMGALIMPASPSFYAPATDIKQLVGSITQRIIDHLGISQENTYRWGEQ